MNHSIDGDRRAPGAVRPVALHQQVLAELRRLIDERRIAPGEKLDEAALVAAFGVSRTPFREAVKLLCAEGIVEIRPGRGARVRRPSPREIVEQFELLGVLEAHALEAVAVRGATQAERARLGDAHEKLHLVLRDTDRAARREALRSAHAVRAELSANRFLVAAHEALTAKLYWAQDELLCEESERRLRSEEDETIEASLARGKGDRTRQLVLAQAKRCGVATSERLAGEGRKDG